MYAPAKASLFPYLKGCPAISLNSGSLLLSCASESRITPAKPDI